MKTPVTVYRSFFCLGGRVFFYLCRLFKKNELINNKSKHGIYIRI